MGARPVGTPPTRFCPQPQATHMKPALSPSWGWQVPPLPQGLLEQLSRDTSQFRPWGGKVSDEDLRENQGLL